MKPRTVLILWAVLLAFGWAVVAFDWFHDLREWLNAPVPTWVVLIVAFVLYAAISEVKAMIEKSHNVITEQLDPLKEIHRTVDRMDERAFLRR